MFKCSRKKCFVEQLFAIFFNYYFTSNRNALIYYLKHHQIDKRKWDKSIEKSSFKSIYALSWYLDCVSPNWYALIEDDYLTCMPLPIKVTFGIPFITQPVLCQQLGVFFTEDSNELDCEKWIKNIPRNHLFLRLTFNKLNTLKTLSVFKLRTNFVLQLSKPYTAVFEHYSNDTKKNIKKGTQKNVIINTISLKECITFFKENNSLFNNEQFYSIFETIDNKGLLKFWGAFCNSELVSVGCFVKSFSSHIYLASCTSEQGRKVSANYILIDSFIQTYSNSNSELDFEGSSIDSIAKFFAGFGADKEEFIQIKRWLLF